MVGDNKASSSSLNFKTLFACTEVDLLSRVEEASLGDALPMEGVLAGLIPFLSLSVTAGDFGLVTAGLACFGSSGTTWLLLVTLALVLGDTVLSSGLSSFLHEEDSRADNSCFSLSRLLRSFQSSSSEDAQSEESVSLTGGASCFSREAEESLESDVRFELPASVVNMEGFSMVAFPATSPSG